MQFFSRFAAGMVFVVVDDGPTPVPSFAGSCGAYMRRDVFLTAGHCVPATGDVYVLAGGEGTNVRRVRHRFHHEHIDLALLVADPPPADKGGLAACVYSEPADKILDGGDFVCFGYPAEGDYENRPTGRTVRGYVQRWFEYSGAGRKPYMAFEMNCPAPGGLSGSLLAYTVEPNKPFAVVTANIDSYTLVERFEEVQEGNVIRREQINRVITYGVAASLTNTGGWLAECIAQADKQAGTSAGERG